MPSVTGPKSAFTRWMTKSAGSPRSRASMHTWHWGDAGQSNGWRPDERMNWMGVGPNSNITSAVISTRMWVEHRHRGGAIHPLWLAESLSGGNQGRDPQRDHRPIHPNPSLIVRLR